MASGWAPQQRELCSPAPEHFLWPPTCLRPGSERDGVCGGCCLWPSQVPGYPRAMSGLPCQLLGRSFSLAPAAYHPGQRRSLDGEVFHPESKLLGRPRGWGWGTGLGRALSHRPSPAGLSSVVTGKSTQPGCLEAPCSCLLSCEHGRLGVINSSSATCPEGCLSL